jgi:IMP dehydrogenase
LAGARAVAIARAHRYRPAMEIPLGLTFDDVLLVPAASDTLPSAADVATRLTREIGLNIPILSAAMDTVTEADMAIVMAQAGGIGVLHRNMTIEQQAEAARQVKRFESGMVVNPITIGPGQTLGEARALMARHRISGIPVVEGGGKLVGILTNRDVRFAEDPDQPVSELMTHEGLVTVGRGVTQHEAKRLLHARRIEKLLVVDEAYRCIGLVTVKDIEKAVTYPNATKDAAGRLRVAAATTTGEEGLERARALIAAECDLIVVDTAHGHSSRVSEAVRAIKKMSNSAQVMAGNVATGEAARALIDAGADAVMIGSLLAGTEEAPGDTFLYQGRSYKSYRGMGSVGAMARGSADRYFQQDIKDQMKLVPEGVEGQVPYKGPAKDVLHQLVGGVKAAMGYTGSRTIADLRQAKMVRITGAGLRESHVHDVTITREAPNYPTR